MGRECPFTTTAATTTTTLPHLVAHAERVAVVQHVGVEHQHALDPAPGLPVAPHESHRLLARLGDLCVGVFAGCWRGGSGRVWVKGGGVYQKARHAQGGRTTKTPRLKHETTRAHLGPFLTELGEPVDE